MHRILFVCHGNICRSPMAEFVMKDLTVKRGLAGDFAIESAACRRDELGNPVHRGTRQRLAREGISCAGKTARLLRADDYDAFDVIAAMDEENMRDMARLFGGDSQGKVRKLMSFAGSSRDVADPWYTGDFDATYDDVLAGCTALLDMLEPVRK
ncbi:low molecular weight protein-tyrosine-phosphatase [Adlercreutzia aquisgranensis]|uniref:low molecular weight protein-tyrosine-phosphatase n=1 Tax=Adlercreutzia aquisgranensis TaxID=2941323 RepID=UPI00203BB5CE|nr:low molecular weight protein-tyrosine-phosphatase [Adlercreutzia aquisgranensis]